MAHIRVMDLVFVGLLIQEVKHVFDGQRQGRATVRCAEDGLKQVIHELLQCPLQGEVLRFRAAQGTNLLGDLDRSAGTLNLAYLYTPTLVASSLVR